MKKRLLSAVLALVLCAYPAMAPDFGTLTISSDREVIDDSVLYELAGSGRTQHAHLAHTER